MKRLLPFLWCFTVGVCALDIYLSSRLAGTLPEMELNPLCMCLLELDGGNPSLLISVKWLTNLLLMLYLILRPSVVNSCVIAGVQLALLFVFWM